MSLFRRLANRWKNSFCGRPKTETTKFLRARDKGGRFLLSNQHPGGGVGNPERGVKDYSKILTAFHVCGYTTELNHLCLWIRKFGMTSDGDFGPRSQKQRKFDYIYPNAWIIMGAHQFGAFDISQKGMEFLLRFQDSEGGGFYSSLTERGADTEQDLIYVGFAGLAALYTGRIEVARGVGRWMKTLLDEQPGFPHELYTVYSRNKGIVTRFEPKEANRYVLSANVNTGDQFFYQVGIAGGFLSRLFLATGDKEYLDLAIHYMQFAEVANDHLFTLYRAGKVGWAASILYGITEEAKYKNMAIRIGNLLVSRQHQCGFWSQKSEKPASIDLTAENVLWLDAIGSVVG